MKLMMQPCTSLIPGKVELDDLKALVEYHDKADTEVGLCWQDLANNTWDDAEVRADFGKALTEEIIWALTILKALEKVDGMQKI